MRKWISKVVNLQLLISLLTVLLGGAATSAVMRSDIQRLNTEVFGRVNGLTSGERLVKIETKLDILLERKNNEPGSIAP